MKHTRDSFIGDRLRPLSVLEMAERRPILGTGKPPAELQALRARRSIFIVGEDTERPRIAVDPVEGDAVHGRPGGWRIEITLNESQQIDVLPRAQLHRDPPEFYRGGIDRAVGYEGQRPDWMDMSHTPRLLPPHELPPMRRLNGRMTRPLWVFGSDDRRLFRDSSYPWGTVGLIENNEGYAGSGTLVARNIVVTAAHLIPWSSGSNGWVKFTPADYLGLGSLFGANVYSYATEVRAYNNGMNVSGYDWAILRLDQPLGDMVGYMGYTGYADNWEGQSFWTVVGYPSGVGPFWQGGIDINDDDEDSNGGQELESVTADITPGNSGGPIFAWWDNNPRVAGVVSGEETEYVFPAATHQDNVFAGGPGFTDLIAWGRSNW
jgi:V8-like Glu-specific endopeptidase